MIGIFAAEGPNGNWIPGDPNELYLSLIHI